MIRVILLALLCGCLAPLSAAEPRRATAVSIVADKFHINGRRPQPLPNGRGSAEPSRDRQGAVRKRSTEKKHPLLVGTSYGGNTVPKPNVVKASDFLLMHATG